MPFVKLDCGILDSTLWVDRASREAFITALLMAEPYEIDEPMEQIEVRTLSSTGWVVPPGKYGLVRAAGVGIVRRAGLEQGEGLDALERLGSPEPDSRSPDHEGRRLIRVDGGFLVLNFFKYRDRDYTAAARQKRYRDKKVTRDGNAVTRNITHAEAEAEAEADGGTLRSSSSSSVRASSSERGNRKFSKNDEKRRSVADGISAVANGSKFP